MGEQVGWPRRPVAKMEAALSNSYMVSTLTLRTQRGSAEAEEMLIGSCSIQGMCQILALDPDGVPCAAYAALHWCWSCENRAVVAQGWREQHLTTHSMPPSGTCSWTQHIRGRCACHSCLLAPQIGHQLCLFQ